MNMNWIIKEEIQSNLIYYILRAYTIEGNEDPF